MYRKFDSATTFIAGTGAFKPQKGGKMPLFFALTCLQPVNRPHFDSSKEDFLQKPSQRFLF